MVSGEYEMVRERLQCQEGDVALWFEHYRLHNGLRNPHRLADGSQEVFLEPHGTPWLAGWRWHWPGDDGQVVAFPQLQYDGIVDGETLLPCPIGVIRQCNVTYEVGTFALGLYSLMLEMCMQRQSSDSPERMIRLYLDSSHGVPLSGRPADRLQLDGVWYDVYPDGATWQASRSVAFVAQIAQFHGCLRLPIFWQYVLRQQFLTPQDVVTRLSFGNEIISGSGETTVYRYAVQLTINN